MPKPKTKTVSQVRLMTYDLKAAPEGMVNQWVESNKANAERIDAKRKLTIPNEVAYKERLAAASSQRYAKTLNPDYISRSGLSARDIRNRQSANIQSAYKKYKAGLEEMFKTVDGIPAKGFKDRIEGSRGHFSEGVAKKVLAFSGSKEQGRGILSIAPLWLTDDPIVEELLRGGDEIVGGGPMFICRPEVAPSFKASLSQRLQQAGAAIVDANFSAEVVKKHNDTTNELVQMFVDTDLGLVPFTTGGDSHVDYTVSETESLTLEIKVSKA